MIKNLVFEVGFVTIVYDNNRRLKVPTDQFTGVVAADVDLTAHAALSSGVHGAGDHTLATGNDILTHKNDASAHHTKYSDQDAVSAMGEKGDSNALNHDRYTDSDAVTAMGAKGDENALNHDKYTDQDAVAAMGTKGDSNALNHDKYTDADAVAAVEAAPDVLDILAGTAVGIQEGTPVNAEASVLETSLDGEDNDLIFTAKVKGEVGDEISVTYVDPGTPDAELNVPEVIGKDIVVNLGATPGVKATASLGEGNNEVVLTADDVGAAGNSLTVAVEVGTTPSGDMSASKDEDDYTVVLGVDAGTKPSAVLTIDGVVIDGETVTLDAGEKGEEVYEFDWDDDVGKDSLQVDISDAASIARAKGTGTIDGLPVHDEEFVIDEDTFVIKRDGSDGEHEIDLTACASAEFGVGRFSLAAIPADGDTVTINGRVYEFDTEDDGIDKGSDVEVDITKATDREDAMEALRDAINADAGKDVTATYNAESYYVEVTAILVGTIGNYVVSEDCDVGGWMVNYGAGGNMVNGANPTTEEIVDQIVADFDGDTCWVVEKQADQFTVQYKEYGSAGNSIVLTESVTGLSFDGDGTLGGSTAGADCSLGDAAAALVAAINEESERFEASANAGVVTVVCNDLPYEDANDTVTDEDMENGSWGANFADGVNPAPDNAKNAAQDIAAALTLLDGISAEGNVENEPLTEAVVRKNFSSGDDPEIATDADAVKDAIDGEPTAAALVTVELAQKVGTGVVTAMAKTHLDNGVDGTEGEKGDVFHDADYLYVCKDDNTTADTNWRRIDLGSAY